MKESASRKLSKMIEKWRIRRKNQGHFVVYTKEGKRHTLPLKYLNHPIFRVLLEMAEEEYGLTVDGPLRVPCDKHFFDYIISIIAKDPPQDVENALLSAITCRGGASSALSVFDPSSSHNDQGGAQHHQAMLLSSCG
ncbi:hypothetical protein Leryth_010656 [Lithospermum erythrorhizon]|uniref:SAUR family protein n=1 Tax=Lithospermum erythrorhizon TaxID=34254 RepID=A0AAV3QY70_LITER|nr:hypothetical protein Leryth_010656 [Lithospermum erythrorhizon]